MRETRRGSTREEQRARANQSRSVPGHDACCWPSRVGGAVLAADGACGQVALGDAARQRRGAGVGSLLRCGSARHHPEPSVRRSGVGARDRCRADQPRRVPGESRPRTDAERLLAARPEALRRRARLSGYRLRQPGVPGSGRHGADHGAGRPERVSSLRGVPWRAAATACCSPIRASAIGPCWRRSSRRRGWPTPSSAGSASSWPRSTARHRRVGWRRLPSTSFRFGRPMNGETHAGRPKSSQEVNSTGRQTAADRGGGRALSAVVGLRARVGPPAALTCRRQTRCLSRARQGVARRPRCRVAARRRSPRSGPRRRRARRRPPQRADAASQAAATRSQRSGGRIAGARQSLPDASGDATCCRPRAPQGADDQDHSRAVARTGRGKGRSTQAAPAAASDCDRRSSGTSWQARDLLIANLLQRVEQLERRIVLSASQLDADGRRRRAGTPLAPSRRRSGSAGQRHGRRRAQIPWSRTAASEPVQMAQAQPLVRPEEEAAPPAATSEEAAPPATTEGAGCADPGTWPVRGRRGSDRSCARADPGPGRRVAAAARAGRDRAELHLHATGIRRADLRHRERRHLRRRAGDRAQRVRDRRHAAGRPAVRFAGRGRHSLQLCRRRR